MSEPTHGEGASAKYVDIPYVPFESGMFQMLHELRDDPSDTAALRWIPVREGLALTTPIPFDFSSDRALEVPRDRDTGEVD